MADCDNLPLGQQCNGFNKDLKNSISFQQHNPKPSYSAEIRGAYLQSRISAAKIQNPHDKQHTSIALSLANTSTPTMKFLALEEWAAANAVYESVDAPYWHVKPVASACTGVSGILWSISYILMATEGFEDKSYSMPIYCLCLNIAWESVHGFVYGPGLVNQIVFAQWMIIDAFLVYSTVKFGKDQWRHSPLVANNLGWIVVFGCIFCTWLHLSIAATFVPAIGRKFVPFTGWSLQTGISIG